MVSRTYDIIAASGDGFVGITSTGSTCWDDSHDATNGDTSNASGTNMEVSASFSLGAKASLNTCTINRIFIPIDLSNIPAGVRFDSTQIKISGVSKTNTDNDGDDWLNIVGMTTQGSGTALSTADFDNCGAVDDPNEYATRLDFSTLITGAYNSWNLNSSGITEVRNAFSNGYLWFGVREGHDCLDNQIANNTLNKMVLSTQSFLNTLKPKLVLTNYVHPQCV